MKRIPPAGSVPRARALRRNATDAEKRLWRMLRTAFPDCHFRRQVPIRHYIVDFASHRHKLIIEADGGQHDEIMDAPRTAILEAEGYCVLRFWNADILTNAEGVLRVISKALEPAHPHPPAALRRRAPPSPIKGEGPKRP